MYYHRGVKEDEVDDEDKDEDGGEVEERK